MLRAFVVRGLQGDQVVFERFHRPDVDPDAWWHQGVAGSCGAKWINPFLFPFYPGLRLTSKLYIFKVMTCQPWYRRSSSVNRQWGHESWNSWPARSHRIWTVLSWPVWPQKKKGPKLVDSLETHFSDSEATWDNFNYKKIMASEVSIAAALAAALARLFMAAILLVSTAPIGSSPVSWLWGRHVILIWCLA